MTTRSVTVATRHIQSLLKNPRHHGGSLYAGAEIISARSSHGGLPTSRRIGTNTLSLSTYNRQSSSSSFSSSSSSSFSSSFSSSSTHATNTTNTNIEQRRHAILTHALQRVHDEGWTDDAIAAGTLDAGLPPLYIGQASSGASLFGSADLVAFFMEECNNDLRRRLEDLRRSEKLDEADATMSTSNTANTSPSDCASRIYEALHLRLSMTLPFVASNRWHEGMAIGALPQNAYRTSQQLDDMAQIVLEYALGTLHSNPAQRAAVIASYAAAELHLISEESPGRNTGSSRNTGSNLSGSSFSLNGERYNDTWTFLRARCEDASRFVSTSGTSSLPFPIPNTTHVVAAGAVASSLAGAALSLAAPSVASFAGNMMGQVLYSVPIAASALDSVGSAFGGSAGTVRDGTHPSDYEAEASGLPPFDSKEEIFPQGTKTS